MCVCACVRAWVRACVCVWGGGVQGMQYYDYIKKIKKCSSDVYIFAHIVKRGEIWCYINDRYY